MMFCAFWILFMIILSLEAVVSSQNEMSKWFNDCCLKDVLKALFAAAIFFFLISLFFRIEYDSNGKYITQITPFLVEPAIIFILTIYVTL